MLRALIDRFRRRRGPEHLETGRWGEEIAERHLRAKGYATIGRRVRAGRRGEIDLIMQRDETMVIVEVKTRSSARYGSGAHAVSRSKKMMLSHAAMGFLREYRRRPPVLRFDIVEVVGCESDGDPEIRHIENAFPLQGGMRLPW